MIVLIVVFLCLRVWASAKAVAITGPSAIKQRADGVIYIMSDDILYLHDEDGGFIDKIPSSRFGVSRFIGDFWVYKNGDILIRREVAQSLTISGWAEFFARTGAGEQDRLGTGESILQRCSIETFECNKFGGGGDVFDKLTAFSLLADEETGTTVLSDTVGHQLLMLDHRGNVIKRSKVPFHFPNQIALGNDGNLYVADTNNHRVVAVRAEQESFGTIVKEFRIVHPRNPLKLTWPMALAYLPDRKWWVINADDNMSYGIVMILNENGVFEKAVPLPGKADPLRLVPAGGNVLVTDPSAMRVYTVNQKGAVLNDFGSLVFLLDLSKLKRERGLYDMVATVSLWALILLLIGALVLARQARLQSSTEGVMQPGQSEDSRHVARAESVTLRYDYHSLLGIHRIKFAVITFLLLAAFSFFLLISRNLTLFHKQFFPAALLGHFAISFFSYLHLKRSYIELTEQGITYQGMSRHIVSPWNGVRKISVYGNTSKIVTDHGNFSIGAIEPADKQARGWLDLLRRQRATFHKQLIEEIQRRAPLAKLNVSWFVRLQWKRP